MSYLLDSNVVSEARRPGGHERVRRWVDSAPDAELFVSVLVLGEVRKGVEKLRAGDPSQAEQIERWLAQLKARFGSRVLGVDAHVADAWGRISAIRPVSAPDALMAATAKVHGLTMVTRNARHFEGLGVAVLDPTA